MEPQIIILHGWTYSLDKWQPILKLLPHSRLLSIPGLTGSLDRPWTLDDYVAWLKTEIRQPTTIIGHSNGGRIALAFAATHPQLVKQLFLIDAAGIRHFSLRRTVFWLLAKLGQPLARIESFRKLVYFFIGERDYLKASPVMRQTMANLINVDLTQALQSIRVPTNIIWGKQDKITPLADGHKIHRLIKNSQLHIIDAGHSPQFTHPEQVAKIIHEYL